MYAQVEKPKENKSRAVANAVGQKKSDVKEGVGFVDNRAGAIAQRKLQELSKNGSKLNHLRAFQSIATDSAVLQRVSEMEKADLERSWETIEEQLDTMYEQDHKATLPIANHLEDIRSAFGLAANKINGKDLISRIEKVIRWFKMSPDKQAMGIEGKSIKAKGGSSRTEVEVNKGREERRSASLSPKLFRHIFFGEINNDDDPTGFHSKRRKSEAQLEAFGNEKNVGTHGVYHQAVRIKNAGKEKGPGSTFFPDQMTEDDIRIAINMRSGDEVTEPEAYAGIRLEKKGDTIYPIG